MLTAMGHEAILYAGEQNEAACAEHVCIYPDEWQTRHFSQYDWRRRVFVDFDPNSLHWREANAAAAEAIRGRAEPGDILGIIAGTAQQPLAAMLPNLWPVEWGIGYSGVWAPYRVFESHAWAAHVAGRLAMQGIPDDARFYDAVIPNSFEEDEFPAGDGSGGYLLFVGRLINRKGPHIAAEAARRLGAKLIVAGQGAASVTPGLIIATDGTRIEGDVEYAGVVGPEERSRLMGAAIATFVPTIYFEPFGGVAAESMLCGTPVLTTAWGAFPEVVRHGETGYLCRTLADFVEGAKRAPALNRGSIRAYARSRFSTRVVAPQYDRYLRKLATLRGPGWYAEEHFLDE
jgi:glycosyltransferase involved in cell wall biosynthesis